MALALAIVLAQLAAATPRAEVALDRVVTVIACEGDPAPRFVLRSDFVLMLRAELVMRGAPDAMHVEVDPLNVSVPFLDQLDAEVTAVREAERALMGDPAPAELSAHRQWIVARLGGDAGVRALLEATGASQADFEALVRRRTVAEAYLVARHARLIEPAVDELRARWEEERRRDATLVPATFAAARSDIARRMVREALPRALRQYLRSLGSRVRVRHLDAPDGAP